MIPVCEQYGVQIVVADNASPDDTELIMTDLSSRYGFIHYFRHPENIGADDNFEFVLKMASTKYRWLMSDTCYVTSIGSLIEDLQSREWDAYILNDPSTRAAFLPKEKRVYTDPGELMSEIGWHLTWMSCMIYHQDTVNSFNFVRYKNSSFNQAALVFEPTANKQSVMCFDPAIVVWNLPVSKDSGWHYKVFDIMYRQWYLLVFALPLSYSYETKMKCYADNTRYAMPLRLYYHAVRRGEGKWNLKDVVSNKFFIKQSATSYVRLCLLGLCPPAMVRGLFFIGHRLNKFMRSIGFKKGLNSAFQVDSGK